MDKKVFECKMCGECCWGEGGIVLEHGEADRIAKFLDIGIDEFLARFCKTTGKSVSVRCGNDLYCIFFEKGRGCTIHPVKPKRCQDWPFYRALLNDPDNWEEAKGACPGISRECSFKEFRAYGLKKQCGP